jgi:hypothetical protein
VEGNNGGQLSFSALKKDQHRDNFGYMWMTIPGDWITPGISLELKITGAAENSTGWYMVFDARDTKEHLQKETEYEGWVELQVDEQGNRKRVMVTGSLNWAGLSVDLKSGARSFGSCLLESSGGKTGGEIKLSKRMSGESGPVDLLVGKKKIATIPAFYTTSSSSQLIPEGVVVNKAGTNENGIWSFVSLVHYRPKLVGRLKDVSSTELAMVQCF